MSATTDPITYTQITFSKASEITHEHIRQAGECIRVNLINLGCNVRFAVTENENGVVFRMYKETE